MSGKRKDLRGRVLRTGESQIKQGKFKGRYQYDWIDNDGVRRHCNSWRLTEADPLPQGKRMCKPLRVLEEEIACDMHDGVDMSAKDRTLNQIFDDVMDMNTGIKQTTRNNYLNQWNCNVRDSLGKRKVTSIKYSDIRKFYQSLLDDKGLNISSVGRIDCRIKSVFQLAVRDNIITADPSRGALRDVGKTATRNPKRYALSQCEQDSFLQYCHGKEGDSGYYLLFVVLFGTGMRIAEALGLTWKDIDFDNGIIRVNRNLMYRPVLSENEKHVQFYVSSTKTDGSKRSIPMLPEVREALIRQREIDLYLDKGFSVDGISNFVFLGKNGRSYISSSINSYILRMVKAINDIERASAENDNREPAFIRRFSVHNCRHTFATRLCEKNVPIKVVQTVLGHTNIQITLNIYAECTQKSSMDAFASLDGFF